jgi:hypothetical protein
MSAREIGRIVIWALLTSGNIAVLLSFIPRLAPDRKGIFNRFGYCFVNYGLSAWFVIEAILFLTTRRWIP